MASIYPSPNPPELGTFTSRSLTHESIATPNSCSRYSDPNIINVMIWTQFEHLAFRTLAWSGGWDGCWMAAELSWIIASESFLRLHILHSIATIEPHTLIRNLNAFILLPYPSHPSPSSHPYSDAPSQSHLSYSPSPLHPSILSSPPSAPPQPSPQTH